MAERGPFRLRNQLHQSELDLHRIGLARQAQSARQPANVCINRDAGRAKGIAENNVCSFAADTGERDKVFERVRNFAAEPIEDGRTAGADILRLVLVETRALDQRFQFAAVAFREVSRGPESREESGRDQIHARVGTLRGQDGRDQ